MNKENLRSVKVKFLKAYSPFKKWDEWFILKWLIEQFPQHFEVLEEDSANVTEFEEKISELEEWKKENEEKISELEKANAKAWEKAVELEKENSELKEKISELEKKPVEKEVKKTETKEVKNQETK